VYVKHYSEKNIVHIMFKTGNSVLID